MGEYEDEQARQRGIKKAEREAKETQLRKLREKQISNFTHRYTGTPVRKHTQSKQKVVYVYVDSKGHRTNGQQVVYVQQNKPKHKVMHKVPRRVRITQQFQRDIAGSSMFGNQFNFGSAQTPRQRSQRKQRINEHRAIFGW